MDKLSKLKVEDKLPMIEKFRDNNAKKIPIIIVIKPLLR